MQSLGAVFDIDLPSDHIRDDGYGGSDVFDERSAFLRIVSGILAQQGGFEANEIGLVLFDIADELGGVVVLSIAIGIFAVGQKNDLHVESFFEEHIYSSQRRMNTCGIAVIEHGDVTGEALNKAYLRFGQSRSAACDYVLDTRLMHRDDIHLSLHEVTHVSSSDGLFGLEKTV